MGWMVVTTPYTIPGKDEYMETFIKLRLESLRVRLSRLFPLMTFGKLFETHTCVSRQAV